MSHDELARDADGDIAIDYRHGAAMLSISVSKNGVLTWASMDGLGARNRGTLLVPHHWHAILSAVLDEDSTEGEEGIIP